MSLNSCVSRSTLIFCSLSTSVLRGTSPGPAVCAHTDRGPADKRAQVDTQFHAQVSSAYSVLLGMNEGIHTSLKFALSYYYAVVQHDSCGVLRTS